MNLEFFPRHQIVDRLKEGWRLIPDHSYDRLEYAYVMSRPEEPEAIVIEAELARLFPPPAKPRGNPKKRIMDYACQQAPIGNPFALSPSRISAALSLDVKWCSRVMYRLIGLGYLELVTKGANRNKPPVVRVVREMGEA